MKKDFQAIGRTTWGKGRKAQVLFLILTLIQSVVPGVSTFPCASTDRQMEGGAHQYICSSGGECREEVCSGLRMHSTPSSVAFFREHHAAEGGHLMTKVGIPAKERRSKNLDTVWQVPVRKKQTT